MNYLDIYKQCMQIRMFEKKVESEFSLGHMRGTTHGCVGQEIIPVLVMEKIKRKYDYITGTHRCHGQVLAYIKDPYRLACEMMGKEDGFVRGMGGSQHIKIENYITNGITGGMVSIGTGIAMGIKKKESPGIVISFLGDGGFNEGYVQESLNLAAHFELPILFVCENNGYAMSTPSAIFSAGKYSDRVRAHDIEYKQSNTANPEMLEKDISAAFDYVRKKRQPFFLDVHTARLCGHSKSDTMEYMSADEKKRNLSEDAMVWLETKLSEDIIQEVKKNVCSEIEGAFNRANECNG